MKIIIDMNLPLKLADLLNEKGFESTHWYNLGDPDAKDTEIMAYARKNNSIVLTCDLDFSAILAATHGQKPSVAQIRLQGFHVEQLADLIAAALHRSANEMEKGAILTIDVKSVRLHLLPLF